MAASTGCASNGKFVGEEIPPPPASEEALLGRARRPDDAGYGADPDLVNPVMPWQRTMNDAQLALTAALCDVILPADDRSPAASAVGVHEFIDEWVSAPYPQQQVDRALILAGLERLERRSRDQFTANFWTATSAQQVSLVEAIADGGTGGSTSRDTAFFIRFRYLAVGAFYTTAVGIEDIGYTGNVPISGDYPGPSDEALAHLSGVLRQLGLQPLSM